MRHLPDRVNTDGREDWERQFYGWVLKLVVIHAIIGFLAYLTTLLGPILLEETHPLSRAIAWVDTLFLLILKIVTGVVFVFGLIVNAYFALKGMLQAVKQGKHKQQSVGPMEDGT